MTHESGDELRDLTEVAVVVAGGRAEAAAAILADLLARLAGGDRWEVRNDLVVDLFAVWRHGGDRAVLAVAVALARSVLDRIPPADVNAEIVHSNIGGLFAAAAVATDDGPLLDDAIEALSTPRLTHILTGPRCWST